MGSGQSAVGSGQPRPRTCTRSLIRTTPGHPASEVHRLTCTHDLHRSRRETWGHWCRRPRGGLIVTVGQTGSMSTADPGAEPCTPPTTDPLPTTPTFHVERPSRHDVGLCAITLRSRCPSPRKVVGTHHAISPEINCRRSVRDGTRQHGALDHGAGETTRGVRSRSVTLREHAEPGPSRRVNVAPPAVEGEAQLTRARGAFSPDR